jgi:hypothetical protein
MAVFLLSSLEEGNGNFQDYVATGVIGARGLS